MSNDIKNYKCPSCTASLRFDGPSGMLVCDFCGKSYTVKEIQALNAENYDSGVPSDTPHHDPDIPAGYAADYDPAPDGMKAYNCKSCGAQLIVDDTISATSCPYCGNATVIAEQLQGGFKPDYVLPFKLTKEQAVEHLKSFYKGKPLLPKAFSANNHINEIKGVYVPFWLFDGEGEADMAFDCENTSQMRQGDYIIVEHRHFNVRRHGSMAFERIPADGSTNMPDAHMDAIEPFDYGSMVPFSSAYLPGFMAEKYDVSAEESKARAEERIANTVDSAVRSTVSGYSSVIQRSHWQDVRMQPAKYALLPVWMLHSKWNGQDFLFAMNGQTGKLVGDLPISKGRALGIFAAIAVPLIAIAGFLFLR